MDRLVVVVVAAPGGAIGDGGAVVVCSVVVVVVRTGGGPPHPASVTPAAARPAMATSRPPGLRMNKIVFQLSGMEFSFLQRSNNLPVKMTYG